MKAIVNRTYGSPDVLRVEEVEKPAPKTDEVLIRVVAASTNAADWHMLRADPFLVRFMSGLTKPKHIILGADVAGVVEAVGEKVTQFKPGDEVYGDLAECGWGAFAEYVCAPEKFIAAKPARLSFEEAAAVPMAAATALTALRDAGKLQAGERVAVNGASGGVGTFAVQIAKAMGGEVTGICSTRNVEMVRSIGADHVVDYKQQDFTKSGEQYDLICDTAAFRSIADYKSALVPGSRYVMVGGSTGQFFEAMLKGPWLSMTSGRKFSNILSRPNQKNLLYLNELIDAGKVKPVIDRRYPLEQVPDAIRYLEEGHTQGKVVINIG